VSSVGPAAGGTVLHPAANREIIAKLTSIASAIALHELMFAARSAQQVTFNYTPLMLATLIYSVLLWPVVRLLSRPEHRKIAAH
jgi:polar amino acid transport system permease protein